MDCGSLNPLSILCDSVHFLGNKRGMLIEPQYLVMCCLCEMLGDHTRAALACREHSLIGRGCIERGSDVSSEMAMLMVLESCRNEWLCHGR